MPIVHLVQCKCPADHAIMAAAFEEPPEDIAHATEMLKGVIELTISSKKIRPFCAICDAPSDQWRFEVRSLENTSLAEIKPILEASERQQRETLLAIQAMRKAGVN